MGREDKEDLREKAEISKTRGRLRINIRSFIPDIITYERVRRILRRASLAQDISRTQMGSSPLILSKSKRKNRHKVGFLFERETVLSSNLPLPLWLFLNLYRLITPDLILKLNLLKIRMDIPSFKNYK